MLQLLITQSHAMQETSTLGDAMVRDSMLDEHFRHISDSPSASLSNCECLSNFFEVYALSLI